MKDSDSDFEGGGGDRTGNESVDEGTSPSPSSSFSGKREDVVWCNEVRCSDWSAWTFE